MKKVFLDTNILVTNNKKDFYEFCQLPFLTSEEFLLQFDYSEDTNSKE